MHSSTRCGIVSVLGAPNAGKSTLVNRLVGAKVTIVSSSPPDMGRSVRSVEGVWGASVDMAGPPERDAGGEGAGDAPVDAFGVGERIVTSPDAPVGVGAVGKLCMVDGRPTMKLSRGSGKATLPGHVQVWRQPGRVGGGVIDTVGLADEDHPGTPLLETVWTDDGPVDLPSPAEVRAHARASVAALPAALKTPRQVEVPITARLAALIEAQVTAG